MVACGDDRNDPPYRSARSSLPGRALVPISQFGVQMKPAVHAYTAGMGEGRIRREPQRGGREGESVSTVLVIEICTEYPAGPPLNYRG